jgi:hypothetical protein
MENLKRQLEQEEMFLQSNKRQFDMRELEETAHRLKVDRLTVQFGEGGVRLTIRNIKISLWVPVLSFLLGTVVFEILKPEIVSGMRQILGLPKIP